MSVVTFVLVHGALFTSSGWLMTQSRLQEKGFNVALVDIPGRLKDGVDPKKVTLRSAAEKVCRVARLQAGHVILVGHSQGGAVISEAASLCPKNVLGLVFVAAVVPKNGETPFQGLSVQAENNFGKCIHLNPDAGLFELKKDGPAGELFLNDLPKEERSVHVANMVSEPMGIGTAVAQIDEDVMDRLPKFYVEATRDLIVMHATQQSIRKNRKWDKVYSMDSGHCPFLSQPDLLTANLIEIAGRVTEK